MSEAKIALSAVDQTKAAFDAVKQGLTGLQTKATAVTGVLAGLGVTAYVGGLAAGVRRVIDEWDELGKAAQRAGFQSAQGMAEFQFAAKLSGLDAAGLEAAVAKLNGKMAETAGGGKQAAAVFDAMGVKVKNASGELRSSEEVLTDLAGKFASYKDGPEKAALAAELFGEKAGRRLIPLLNGGAAGLEKLREEFRKLHGVVSDESVKSAEAFNDNLTRLEAKAGGLARKMTGDLLPALNLAGDAMVEQAKRGGKLLTIWAGLSEMAKLITGTDAIGQKVTATSNADQQLAMAGNKLQFLLQSQKNGGDSEPLRAEIKSVRAEVERLQGAALAASHSLKAALNPNYEVDPSYQSLEDKRLAAQDGRRRAPTVPKDSGAGGSDGGDAILKRVKERLAAQTAELSAGRALTDQEKFATKVEEDLKDVKGGVDAATRKQIQSTLALSNAEQRRLDGRTRQLAMDKAIVEDQEQTQSELFAADADSAKSRDQYRLALLAETNALADVQTQLDLEGKLIGATDRERQIALDHLRIELKLRQDLDALNRNLNFDESQRDEERARLRANAAIAKAQVGQRVEQDAEQQFVSDFRGDVRGALVRAFEDSKNPAKAFIEAFASTLYSRVAGKLADALTDALFKSVGGGSGGGGLVGSLLRSAGGSMSGSMQASFSGTSLGSSGFGSGAAYGNADLGLFLHSGGIAGQEHTFTRPVDPTVFRHAPRFHTGGVAGDEVPAVLKRGEGVFTPGQMKALGGGSGDMKLTIINNTSAPIGKVHERRISANERALIIEEARQANVAALHNANSPESKALGANFGLSRRR